MTARDVAMKLLLDHGCELDCYRNDKKNHAFSDLKEIDSSLLCGFDLVEVAKELQKIGDEQPTKMKNPEWHISWDCGDFVDGRDCEDLEDAANDAIETLIEWQHEMISKYNIKSEEEMRTNQEFIDAWNRMIYDCGCYFYHREPIPVPADTPYYEMGWEEAGTLSYEQEKEIGWVELPDAKEEQSNGKD